MVISEGAGENLLRSIVPEWPQRLDVPALQAAGWRPTPFRQFVLKVHSRCDLACDYCYMYEMADQSWRNRPRQMSEPVVRAVAERIAEHARAHDLSAVTVVLHGGEPLLAGADSLRRIVRTIRDEAGPGTRVDVVAQTNGTLLDEPLLRLFDQLDVVVGVSLDGDAAAQDRHRRRPGGKGSHAVVARALGRLTQERYRRLFGGLLCTIDLQNDPVLTYEALLEFGPPAIDFLLPHGNWSEPPPGWDGAGGTPYADWLIEIFNRWYAAPRRETEVRLFGEIIKLLLGGDSAQENIGLSPVAVITVETDGEIEQSDFLKSAFDGAPMTGLHVLRDSFDDALALPSIAARQIGRLALSKTCGDCEFSRVCGGGLYAHRYRAGTGFDNPSVYCRDLFRLIAHIRDVVRADVRRLQGRQA